MEHPYKNGGFDDKIIELNGGCSVDLFEYRRVHIPGPVYSHEIPWNPIKTIEYPPSHLPNENPQYGLVIERSIFHHPTLRRSVGQARRERLEGDVIKATAWDSCAMRWK